MNPTHSKEAKAKMTWCYMINVPFCRILISWSICQDFLILLKRGWHCTHSLFIFNAASNIVATNIFEDFDTFCISLTPQGKILPGQCTVDQIGPLASGQWFFNSSPSPNCSCNWKCFLGLPQLNKIPKISISGQTFLNPSPLFRFRPYQQKRCYLVCVIIG